MHLTFPAPVFLVPCLLAQGPPSSTPRPEAMPIPQCVVMPRGDHAIAIDGSVVDWPDLPAIRLDDQRLLSGTAATAWRGPADLSAVAFLLWDAKALYVACVVKDEWHRALDAKALMLTEVPPADCVVLTFDPGRDTRGIGPDPGRRDDREFWLADESGRQVVLWDRLRGAARTLEGEASRVVVLHDKERSVTTCEAMIPWSEILPVGGSAAAGLVFDMQIVVNDFDETTDGMPQTRIGWTFGSGPVIDPGQLGSVMLVDAEAAAARVIPAFPAKPAVDPVPGSSIDEWKRITSRLLELPPVVFDGTKSPEETGGLARFALLEEIDGHCQRFPRVDFVELHHRIHRRMQREVAGIQASGLPWWWSQRLRAVSKSAEDQVPNATVRLFRLPMGGWLVRTTTGGFLIDPAGADLPEWLWGGSDFVLLTQPLDMTKRNDQMLIRMLQSSPPRPVFTHIAFHLPVVSMSQMPLFEPGQDFAPAAGAEVRALGKKLADGSVTWSLSYTVAVPAGPKLMVVGQNLLADEADVDGIDVMILSPRNAEGPQIVRRVKPALVVMDEAFSCEAYPNLLRVGLKDLHALQRIMQTQRSLILAPGESWDISVARPK